MYTPLYYLIGLLSSCAYISVCAQENTQLEASLSTPSLSDHQFPSSSPPENRILPYSLSAITSSCESDTSLNNTPDIPSLFTFQERFAHAIKEGDYNEMLPLLTAPEITWLPYNTLTSHISLSAEKGHIDITLTLLQKYPFAWEKSLIAAAAHGQEELLSILLNWEDPEGNQVTRYMKEQALFSAAKHGNTNAIPLLFSEKKNKENAISLNAFDTAIDYAAQKKQWEFILHLVEIYPSSFVYALQTAILCEEKSALYSLLAWRKALQKHSPILCVAPALYTASQQGNKEIVDFLCKWMENHTQEMNTTILENATICAVATKQIPLVLHLLEKAPDNLESVFKAACNGGHNSLVDILLQWNQGSTITLPIVRKGIMEATHGGCITILDKLIRWEKNYTDSLPLITAQHAITIAVHTNQRAVLFYLLQRFPTSISHALLAACTTEDTSLVDDLLNWKDAIKSEVSKGIPAALYEASLKGTIDNINLLFAWGVRNNYQLTLSILEHMMSRAIKGEHEEVVLHILYYHPEALLTALKTALYKNQTSLFTSLCMWTSQTGDGITPVMIEELFYEIATRGNQAMNDLLLNHVTDTKTGIRISALKKALHAALKGSHFSIMLKILAHYPLALHDILCHAASTGSLSFIKLLLSDTSPLRENITTAMVESTLYYAARQGNKEITHYLLSWKDISGQGVTISGVNVAFSGAAKQRQWEVTEVLSRWKAEHMAHSMLSLNSPSSLYGQTSFLTTSHPCSSDSDSVESQDEESAVPNVHRSKRIHTPTSSNHALKRFRSKTTSKES